MISGLTAAEFNFLHDKLILPLKNKNAKVYLFGSRANGKYKKFSDIDLLYVASKSEKIPSHFIHELLQDIEDSRFSYKVDLVDYNELALSYKKNVDVEKIEL